MPTAKSSRLSHACVRSWAGLQKKELLIKVSVVQVTMCEPHQEQQCSWPELMPDLFTEVPALVASE